MKPSHFGINCTMKTQQCTPQKIQKTAQWLNIFANIPKLWIGRHFQQIVKLNMINSWWPAILYFVEKTCHSISWREKIVNLAKKVLLEGRSFSRCHKSWHGRASVHTQRTKKASKIGTNATVFALSCSLLTAQFSKI